MNNSNTIPSNHVLNRALKIFLLICIYLSIHVFSFIPSYGVGTNLDDKSYYLVSSILAEKNNTERRMIFNKFVSPLELKTEDQDRYKYRFNVVGNTLLPSWLMRIANNILGDSEKSISLSFYLGYSIPFFLSCILLIYSYIYLPDYRNFIFIYSLLLFFLLTLRFLNNTYIDNLFGINFAPGTSSPRGSVSLVSPVFFLSLIVNKIPLFAITSFFMTLTHSASSLYLHLMCLPYIFLEYIRSRKLSYITLIACIGTILPAYLLVSYRIYPVDYSSISTDLVSSLKILNILNPPFVLLLISFFCSLKFIKSKANKHSRSLAQIAITMTSSNLFIITTSQIFYSGTRLLSNTEVSGRLYGLTATFIISVLILFRKYIGIKFRLYRYLLSGYKIIIALFALFVISFSSSYMSVQGVNKVFQKSLSKSVLRIPLIINDYKLIKKHNPSAINIPINKVDRYKYLTSKDIKEYELFLLIHHHNKKNLL